MFIAGFYSYRDYLTLKGISASLSCTGICHSFGAYHLTLIIVAIKQPTWRNLVIVFNS